MVTSSTSPGGSGRSIFGRERELARLDDLVEGLPQRGAALVVRGEAGIGKSALLTEASQRAMNAGMRVLRTTGVQSEAALPFAGLHQLLIPLLDGVDRLPAPQRTALLAAFGMTQTLEAPDRFLIGLAVLELLSDAAERTLVLVVADDAQWLDPSTAAVLGFVARRIELEPVGLLLAIRSGEADPFAEGGLTELALGGLSDRAARELLAAQERALAPEVRRSLMADAAGNPLALIELPVPLSAEELAGGAPLPSPLPLTTRLERAFAAQGIALPAATRNLLLIASADDGGGSLGEILEATRAMVGDGPTAEDLAPAVSARLVDLDVGRVVFRHPLVRSAIHQAASLAQRRAAHAAFAQVLDDQPDRQVWHRAADLVGPDETVATALEEAAERARLRGAIGTAIRALERSVALGEDSLRSGRRLLEAAELAFETGRRELARQLLTEAHRLDLSTAERQRMFFIRRAFSDALPARNTGLRDMVEAAERIERSGDPTTATNLLLAAATQSYASSASDEARREIISVIARLSVDRDDPRLVLIRAIAAPVSRGSEVVATLARLPPDGGGDAEAARLFGFAASIAGDPERSTTFLSASVDALRMQGRVALLAQALVLRAYAHWRLDRWEQAASDAAEGRRLCEETGQPIWAAGAATYESLLAAVRGEAERVEALAEEVERISLPLGIRILLTSVQWARGLAALGTGHYEEAYEHLIRAFREDDPAWHYSERHVIAGDLAEAARYAGYLDTARSVVAETEAAVAGTGSPAGHYALAHARAMLAGEDDAEERFQDALTAMGSRRPFLRARLHLAHGGWLRRERRVMESRAPLRAAREGFDALGAAGWAERARQELRASGVRSRPRERAAVDDLTTQELQIARLAASGLSNRDIGQQLFLSHRTVGVHLYRAFPKLGIASRGQLRDVLDPTRF